MGPPPGVSDGGSSRADVRLLVMTAEADRWHIGDRHYGVTAASTPDSFDLELEDLGPGTGRGFIAIASMSDGIEAVTLRVLIDHPLPLELLERFIAEARLRL
jgi:hypothetical protein